MEQTIQDGKLVELTYTITDDKSGQVLTSVEFPLGYVHGHNEILAPAVHAELEGKTVDDVIAVPIDCNQLYPPRDETLVITDLIENVPDEYREVGTTIIMESDTGLTKNFIVTRIDEKSITIDGNNPLCGRQVTFNLDIISIRDATQEEMEEGGPALPEINVEGTQKISV
ncbi:FKBP-type peptidyl-prolyl cis-trans isomerase SlyD [hydrothermal vent metagenome]|uniref:peptidylprolyl isomerase n=1 Tax=hydrothermal vent metagenome TaxID=652676 RepID=A0A3B0SBB0_9ZZZZ